MNHIKQWLEFLTGVSPDNQHRLIASFLILVFFGFLRFVITRIIWRKVEDVQVRYRWKNITTYLFYTIVLLLVGRVWFKGFDSIATVLGLFSAGLAFALQDLVKSIAGWIFILWRRPFVVGDRIEIAKMKGDVIDVRLFQFSLLEIGNRIGAEQSTGRVIHIPNAIVFTESTANYTSGFAYIWNEIDVLLTFESDWKKAKSILQKIAEKHAEGVNKHAAEKIREASKKYMIYYSNLSPKVYTNVKDSGVLLSLRYLTEPRKKRNSEEHIWEEILTEFSPHPDIDFAYPTQRIYYNPKEKKKGNGN
ncbi:MAG: mechanosensitive ion channel family protein [Leptospiraceae bacterium]|nr:mechanosensitive ion channel family protein [Leptospiraceae bacterium]